MKALIDGHEIEVNQIIKKTNKNIYMRFRKGVIIFTTPVKLSDSRMKELINKNYNYFHKSVREYYNGASNYITYLGQRYNLVLRQTTCNFVYISDNNFIVEYIKEANIQKNIIDFYYKGLKFIVDRYKDEIFKKFNLKNPIIYYKYISTFFGKCYPRLNKICLNVKLAKYDIKYILSVIYHECAHFKVQNHQKEFYDHLESIYPNYRKVQKELRSIKFNEKY